VFLTFFYAASTWLLARRSLGPARTFCNFQPPTFFFGVPFKFSIAFVGLVISPHHQRNSLRIFVVYSPWPLGCHLFFARRPFLTLRTPLINRKTSRDLSYFPFPFFQILPSPPTLFFSFSFFVPVRFRPRIKTGREEKKFPSTNALSPARSSVSFLTPLRGTPRFFPHIFFFGGQIGFLMRPTSLNRAIPTLLRYSFSPLLCPLKCPSFQTLPLN